MVDENFQKTGLWRSAFSAVPNDPFAQQRTRLLASLMACRENIKPIVERIANVLPGLTVHDISHLDGLWETADLIAGADYELNPLEAYVFGLSVLFHDSAMCWEAYERGCEGVRASIEWKDSYAHECDESPDMPDEERRAVADFVALRALHAHQASKLSEVSWRHPDTGSELYLIDDAQLRTEIGDLAGKIAASHHWDIEALSVGLGEQINAPSSFPSDWSVDPVKIACLLRCADAAHISQARAPLFLYALIKRQGVSFDHWKAQNRMMGPSLDAGDPSKTSIVYTSSRAFKESDSAAWWIAHDAISIIAQEITSSNELLRHRNRHRSPEFTIKQVKGTESINELVRHLRVEGWMPCGAKPHVSNIESLVKELGGEKLYGKGSSSQMIGVVLREMIQNARDAVVARKFVELGFDGEILVRLTSDQQGQWLCVEDNGIGMSQRVMTGPLLDFGHSFWRSSLLQTEFPGLRSSRFRSIGQFGIGFYSIFMIADSVEVTSKVWDKGLGDSNTLVFTSGVSLRPILRPGRPVGFASQISTRVRAKVKPGLLSPTGEISIKPPYMGAEEFGCSIAEFIAALVVGLDVRVRFQALDGEITEIHTGTNGTAAKPKEILSRVCFLPTSRNAPTRSYIEANYDRLRPIQIEGRVVGMAAIATHQNSQQMLLGMRTVGGLSTSFQGGGDSSFIGYIDCNPQSAKRDVDGFEAPSEVMSAWAMEQLNILENINASDLERTVAAAHAPYFDCDPIEFGRVVAAWNDAVSFISYDQLATMAETTPVAIFKTPEMDHADTYHSVNSVESHVLIRPIVNSVSCNLKMIDGKPVALNSIIGCLHRAIVNKGRIPNWTRLETAYRSIFGQPLELLVVSSLPA